MDDWNLSTLCLHVYALVRSGLQAEAIAAYEQARTAAVGISAGIHAKLNTVAIGLYAV